MYYEDPSSRFNLVSGLVSGAVLGAGVALLLAPSRPSRKARRLRRRAADLGREAARGIREGASRGLAVARERVWERTVGGGAPEVEEAPRRTSAATARTVDGGPRLSRSRFGS
jgi:gas vesicle protein